MFTPYMPFTCWTSLPVSFWGRLPTCGLLDASFFLSDCFGVVLCLVIHVSIHPLRISDFRWVCRRLVDLTLFMSLSWASCHYPFELGGGRWLKSFYLVLKSRSFWFLSPLETTSPQRLIFPFFTPRGCIRNLSPHGFFFPTF